MSPTAFYISMAWVTFCALFSLVVVLRNERGDL